MSDSLHPIQVVVDRTGLSAHVIRIWEKRYGAVTPDRTETNRRLYSEDQIERLNLLRRLADTGHGIGYVAKLPTEKLRTMVDPSPSLFAAAAEAAGSAPVVSALLARALDAVQRLDARALGDALKAAEVKLGAQGVLQRVVAPLAHAIGEQWRDGTITAAHEHFATAVLRLFLGHAAKPFAATRNAPVLVAVTPAGQLHELGALLAGAAAANLGWQVIYLGPSLAAADIANVAKQNHARVVALSLVYPDDDPQLAAELARLREFLPDTAILAGGRAVPAYRDALDRMGAISVRNLAEFGEILDRVRKAK